MQGQIIITIEEKEKLEKEYRHLIDVERPDVIERIASARSQGDLSENADYDAARERQAQLESRIKEVESILDHAIIFDYSSATSDEITIGHRVVFQRKGDNEKIAVKIVGNVGANPLAELPMISNESPLGKALIGHKIGDVVVVDCAEPYEVKIIFFDRS